MHLIADTMIAGSSTVRGRAAQNLRQLIREGRLPAGEQLPSERELADHLRIGRSTLRLSLKQLEEEGMIRSQGQGKKWIVSSSSGPGWTVLSRTVAILTDPPGSPPLFPAMRTTGLHRFIETGAVEAVRSAELHAMLLDCTNIDDKEMKRLASERLRGVIVLHPVLETEAGRRGLGILRQGGVCVVGYGHSSDFADYDTVASDHAAGSYALTKWLIEHGRRRILRYCPQGRWSSDAIPGWLIQRGKGYEQAMTEAGLTPLPPLSIPNTRPSSGESVARDLATHTAAGYLAPHLLNANPIDAIMGLSDGHIPELAGACRILGKRPNEDVALVGYDNYWADMVDMKQGEIAPMATMDKLNLDIGQELIRLLLGRCARELPVTPQHRLVPPRLVEIDSWWAQR